MCHRVSEFVPNFHVMYIHKLYMYMYIYTCTCTCVHYACIVYVYVLHVCIVDMFVFYISGSLSSSVYSISRWDRRGIAFRHTSLPHSSTQIMLRPGRTWAFSMSLVDSWCKHTSIILCMYIIMYNVLYCSFTCTCKYRAAGLRVAKPIF